MVCDDVTDTFDDHPNKHDKREHEFISLDGYWWLLMVILYLDLFTQIHFPDRINSVDLLFLSLAVWNVLNMCWYKISECNRLSLHLLAQIIYLFIYLYKINWYRALFTD